MKVVHICLCGPVTDGWNYQDNMLTKYHRKMGNEVTIITCKSIWGKNGVLEKDTRSNYINENDIKVIRLENRIGRDVTSKFKVYKSLYKSIENEKPDILFIHGVAFLDVITIRKYLKKNNTVKVFVDNHSDFSNSATSWVSLNILHKVIWRHMAKIIEPYTEKFYGVMPARVDFLTEIYNTPKEKTELLVMGGDDEKISEVKNPQIINKLRETLNISDSDFVIVTGGKIDEAKAQTLLLMEAVKNFNDNVKLIVFGSVAESLKSKFDKLCDSNNIIYAGWVSSDDSYKYFELANLVVFAGRHSVFWEQVVAQGKPMVCKHWEGTTHIDVGGNVKFLIKDDINEIYNTISNIILDDNIYSKMKEASENRGSKRFSYKNISEKSISM
ncbi:glycosyltransferase family 4 protein [Clostridium sp.]|uniref:glycosyltransferase family 4 protein n=1 Tax=Clostridium sp. TaxID=1506 RepID=UPI0025BB8080|nr:glycosyltransferase family 4 protein [Clostridium sp.]